jgi:adenylate kinase
MRIALLGPPGAGKGTQAHRLADRFDLALIGTGDIFRTNVQAGTELGREAKTYMDAGELVPDEVVVRMVVEGLKGLPNGFILDGFPRTLIQAQALENELAATDTNVTTALAFDIDDEIAVKRLAGRRTCRQCQRTYNVEFKPPKVEGVCDVCEGELVHRSDDEEETVRRRIDLYHRTTEPLIRFYWERGLLRVVDAHFDEDEVTERAVAALNDRGPFED